jgi:hypothetical protein
LVAGLMAAPAWAHEKRTDRCGCHHEFGLRHCHPNKKTQGCEAPVKAKVPAQPKAAPKPDTRL